MAIRPGWTFNNNCVFRHNFEFTFNSGFAPSQKKKNIQALHKAIGKRVLEVSTKSDSDLGLKLSAFNLKLNGIPLECIFQSSKVYENGGPYLDMLGMEPRAAKRDERHKNSGRLVGFKYNYEIFKLEPKTFFYDYIYTLAVKESIDLNEIIQILEYDYFTDIEFVPSKSVNCQAKTVALIKAMLIKFGEIPDFSNLNDFEMFYKMIKANEA